MSRDFDHVGWYDRVAERFGGYTQTWSSVVEGRSGEDAFVELLHSRLEPHMHVLDAGCGSGEFTLEVSRHSARVTGFDFAAKMIAAADENAARSGTNKVRFEHADTRDLPFGAESFDLIYSRRGPTSILLHPELLRPGGWMIGVHSERRDVVEERLASSGLLEARVDEFEAREVFDSAFDFAAFWSRMPGHPDYLAPEHRPALASLMEKYADGDRLCVQHYRFVWQGRRG
ncbi:MAG TPA: class I SAM-dependent methyltransferase [Trueperaceae bacterium]